jgi:hypothetical protein
MWAEVQRRTQSSSSRHPFKQLQTTTFHAATDTTEGANAARSNSSLPEHRGVHHSGQSTHTNTNHGPKAACEDPKGSPNSRKPDTLSPILSQLNPHQRLIHKSCPQQDQSKKSSQRSSTRASRGSLTKPTHEATVLLPRPPVEPAIRHQTKIPVSLSPASSSLRNQRAS